MKTVMAVVLASVVAVLMAFAVHAAEPTASTPQVEAADVDGSGVLDDAAARYGAAAMGWAEVIEVAASWLFWTLATISMVWTFGMMALRKADIGEVVAELVRFMIVTGFFFWLLDNGPDFAMAITNSMKKIGANALGLSAIESPSGLIDAGFQVFVNSLRNWSVLDPMQTFTGVSLALIILAMFAIVAVNMLVLLVTEWTLAYAGIFFLGFGGGRWTSDIAINYYKTVLAVGVQLLATVLLVGVGRSFVDDYISRMGDDVSMHEMGVLLVIAVVLFYVVNRIPPLLAQIPFGGGTGGHVAGFGAGAVVGAAAAATAAMATGGAMFAAGAANLAGGASAIMAAVQAGGAVPASFSGGAGDSGTSGAVDSASASPLSDAMGGGVDNEGLQRTTDHSDGVASRNTSASESPSAAEGSPGGSQRGFMSALAQGAAAVAKQKGNSVIAAAQARIGETVGGQIAAAIRARSAEAAEAPTFNGDSLAGSTAVDADAETAAFVGKGDDSARS